MCKTISFNSWNEYFKAPFGALKTNEGAKIRVNSNSDNTTLSKKNFGVNPEFCTVNYIG